MIIDLLTSFHIPLAVMGWDDLLMAMAAAAASKGVESAMTPSQNSSSTGIGNVPQLQKPDDPFAWFSSIMKKGGS